jgi:hypothetical protein
MYVIFGSQVFASGSLGTHISKLNISELPATAFQFLCRVSKVQWDLEVVLLLLKTGQSDTAANRKQGKQTEIMKKKIYILVVR